MRHLKEFVQSRALNRLEEDHVDALQNMLDKGAHPDQVRRLAVQWTRELEALDEKENLFAELDQAVMEAEACPQWGDHVVTRALTAIHDILHHMEDRDD